MRNAWGGGYEEKSVRKGGGKRTEAVVVMRVISGGLPQNVRMCWVSHYYFQSCRRSPRSRCLHSRLRTTGADDEIRRKVFQERLPRLWKLCELLRSSSRQYLLLLLLLLGE